MPKAVQTRALIIEKTAPLFNKKGFAGTSLSDMEHATGLTKGSIYNNFNNKDEVALAVFDHNLAKVNSIIREEMERHESTREKLLAYVKIYSGGVSKNLFPDGGCPILNTSVDSDDTHPALRKKASAAVMAWKHTIVTLIEKGVQNREFKKGVDADEAAFAMIAAMEGGIMISKVTNNSKHLRIVMRSVEKMIHDLG